MLLNSCRTFLIATLACLAFAVRADNHDSPGDWTLAGSPFGVPVLIDTNIYSGPIGLIHGYEANENTAATGEYDYYTVFDANASNVVTYGYFDSQLAPGYFSPDKADQLGRLLSVARTLDTSNVKLAQSQAASVQLAIWEIVFDDGASVLSGAFRTVDGIYSAAVSPEALFADQLLARAATAQNTFGAIVVKELEGAQDVIVFTSPVPEPSTALLMLLGFVGIACRRSRAE